MKLSPAVRVPAVDAFDERVLVDGVGQGDPQLGVLERRVPVADRRAVVERGTGVERDLVEAGVGRVPGRDAVDSLEALEDVGAEVVGEVDLATLERLGERVVVLEHPEDDLVDLRLAAVVVGVGLEPEELALLVLGDDVRPGADHAVGAGLVGELPHLLLVDVLPDVLREDVDVEVQHDRGRLLHREDDGGVVGRLHRRDGRDVVAEVGRLVLAVDHPVERVDHVRRGQRLAVRPLQVRPQVVGPGEAVLGRVPALGQRRLRREVLLAVVGQRLVVHLVHLVGRRHDPRERVERVDVLLDPDRERRRVAGGPRGGHRPTDERRGRRDECHGGERDQPWCASSLHETSTDVGPPSCPGSSWVAMRLSRFS